MAIKNRKKRQRIESSDPLSDSGETRRAEVATIAWMLCCLITTAAQAVAALGWYLGGLFDNPHETALRKMFTPCMLFAAVVSGVCCLVLTPLVYRWRFVKPPPVIFLVAVVAGSLPLVWVWFWTS